MNKLLVLNKDTGCLNIYRTNLTANKSAYDNVAFFFDSDLKIEFYNNC